MYSACVVSQCSSDPAVGAFCRIYKAPSQFMSWFGPWGLISKDRVPITRLHVCTVVPTLWDEDYHLHGRKHHSVLCQLAPTAEPATITNVYQCKEPWSQITFNPAGCFIVTSEWHSNNSNYLMSVITCTRVGYLKNILTWVEIYPMEKFHKLFFKGSEEELHCLASKG